MGHKIKFNINKSTAIDLISGLQKLIDGHVTDKEGGICYNIYVHNDLMNNKERLRFRIIFEALGYKDPIYPIGGEEEYLAPNLWTGQALVKRVALCKRMIGLLQETFNIK